jgi:hypothetical protein
LTRTAIEVLVIAIHEFALHVMNQVAQVDKFAIPVLEYA